LEKRMIRNKYFKYLCYLSVLIMWGLFPPDLKADKSWKPAGKKIKTTWGEKIDVKQVLPEYPRPQLKRKEWKNLNGLWDYRIQHKFASFPAGYPGKILVPFAVESSLSGVKKRVGAEKLLWYRRYFTLPPSWLRKKIILHFGAVDWEARVYVNKHPVGIHRGGYDPFSFDITPYLDKNGRQELIVAVWDPTDTGYQPRGKQTGNPRGIWYTPVTGIWQTWKVKVEW